MQITFKRKIIGICILWALLFVACGGIVYLSQQKQNHVQKELEHSRLVVQSFNNLLTIMINLETGIRGYLLSSDDSYLEPFNQNEAKFDQEVRVTLDLIKDNVDLNARLAVIVENKKLWITGPAVEEMMARKKLTRNMITIEDFNGVFKRSKGKELTDKIRLEVNNVISAETNKMNLLGQEQAEAALKVKYSILFGFPISIFLGLTLIIFTVSKVNFIIQNVVSALFKTSNAMDESSRNLTSYGVELGKATAQTTNSTQKTASAIEQINSMTESNVTAAQNSLTTVTSCLSKSEEGQIAGDAIKDSMREIDICGTTMVEKVAENNKRLLSITDMMREIQSKTKVINDIVFQTKLLSFNASVEAARAGEHGKGFSIVAKEIGSLASVSGGAAQEIDLLLSQSSSEVNNIIKEATESMAVVVTDIQSRINNGSSKSTVCSDKLNEIGTQVLSVQGTMNAIVSASQEQALGIKTVSSAIYNIEQSAQQQSSLFVQYSDTAHQLKEFSESMEQKISELIILFGKPDESKKEKIEEDEKNEKDEKRAA